MVGVGNGGEVESGSSSSDHIAARKKAGERWSEPGVEWEEICKRVEGKEKGKKGAQRDKKKPPEVNDMQ